MTALLSLLPTAPRYSPRFLTADCIRTGTAYVASAAALATFAVLGAALLCLLCLLLPYLLLAMLPIACFGLCVQCLPARAEPGKALVGSQDNGPTDYAAAVVDAVPPEAEQMLGVSASVLEYGRNNGGVCLYALAHARTPSGPVLASEDWTARCEAGAPPMPWTASYAARTSEERTADVQAHYSAPDMSREGMANEVWDGEESAPQGIAIDYVRTGQCSLTERGREIVEMLASKPKRGRKAKAANASVATESAPAQGKPLSALTVPALRALLVERGIKAPARARKADLLALLA